MTFFRIFVILFLMACVGCTDSQKPEDIRVGEEVVPPTEIPILDTKTTPQPISPTNTINPPTSTPTHPSTPTNTPQPTLTPTSTALPWGMLDDTEQWAAFVDINSNLLLAYEDGNGGGLLAEGVSLAAVYLGDACPRWSPDGRKIAFSTSMKNVTVKDVIDGSSISIGVDSDLSSFAWHPGGKMLAVIGVNSSGLGGVHLVDAQDGKELAYVPGRWAAFSPDGSRLAVVRTENDGPLTNQIHIYELVIDPATGLVTGYNPPETRTLYLDYLWNPIWSPDGQSLAFAGGIYGVGSGNPHAYQAKTSDVSCSSNWKVLRSVLRLLILQPA